MRSVWLILLLFLSCFTFGHGGHIYSWDVMIEYQNAGEAKAITLHFALESGLRSNNNIYIYFPQSLSTSSTCRITNGLSYPSTTSCQVSTTGSTVIVTPGISLIALSWYKLEITLTNQNSQTEGYQGVISMETASSTDSKRIIYDINRSLGVYQLAAKPLALLELTLSLAKSSQSSIRSTLGGMVDYFLDIKPKMYVPGGAIWAIKPDNTAYSFSGLCNSTAFDCGSDGCSGRIDLLEGVCEVASDGTYIKFTTSKDIKQDTTFRINVNITNPTYLTTSAGLIVQSESRLTALILEKKTFAGLFSVTGITVGTPTIKYLWGVSSSSIESTKTLCPFGFYKGGGTYPVYNNFELTFTVGATPIGQSLRVEFSLPSSTEIGVLPGSIYTDMPQFPGKATKVTVDSTNAKIIIENVGPLTNTAGQYYKLRGRCHFFSTATSTSLGIITVKTLNSEGIEHSIALGTSSSGVSFGTLIKNYEYLDRETPVPASTNIHSNENLKKIGYSFISAKLGAQSVNYPWKASVYSSNGSPGIPLSSTSKVQSIIFNIVPSLTHICCATSSCQAGSAVTECSSTDDTTTAPPILLGMIANSEKLSLSTDLGRGIKVYESWWSECRDSAICTNLGRSESSNLWNNWQITSNIAYLRFVCQSSGVTDNTCLTISNTKANTYSGLVLEQKDGSTNGIYNTGMETLTKLYGTQDVIDFIICFSYASGQTTAPSDLSSYTLASQTLLNVFVTIPTKQNNVVARFINYANNLNIDYFANPTFLRVSGYFTALASSGKHLAVFVDDNIDISTAYTTNGCISSIKAASCVSYPQKTGVAGNYGYSQRVDLINVEPNDGDATTAFEHFIPVKTTLTNTALPLSTFNIDIAVLSPLGSDTRFFDVKAAYRVAGFVWGGFDNAYPISMNTPNLPILGDSSNGQLASSKNCGNFGNNPNDWGFPVNDANFQPGFSYIIGAQFKLLLPVNNCLDVWKSTSVGLGGTGVVIAHKTLDLAGSSVINWTSFQNLLCRKFTLKENTNTAYGIICILNKHDTSDKNVGEGSFLQFSPFTVPWIWGKSYPAASVGIHVSWSGEGELTGYHSHQGMGNNNYATGCSVTDWGDIFKGTNMQRLRIMVTPSSGVHLTFDAGSFITFKNVLDGASELSGWSVIPICQGILSSGTIIGCTFGYEGNGVYSIQLTHSKISTSLAEKLQDIYFFGNQATTVPVDRNFYLQIYAAGYLVDVCDFTSMKRIVGQRNEDLANFVLGSPNLILSDKVKTSFDFVFALSGTNRKLWKGTTFSFTLGWLGENLGLASSNMHCLVGDDSGVNFSFDQLDLTTPSAPKLRILEDISLQNFRFICHGAIAPSLTTQTNITLTWLDPVGGTLDSAGADDQVKPPSSISKQNLITTILLTKNFNTQGFDANYNFTLKPVWGNYTFDSRIYVQFHIDISPSLNRVGAVKCFINQSECYCEIISERFLSIQPTFWIYSGSVIILEIRGIAQAKSFSGYKSISVAFDVNNNPYDGVKEWGEVDDISPDATSLGTIGIIQYGFSSNSTRILADLNIIAAMPAGSIKADGAVWVELPHYFENSINDMTFNTDSCSIARKGDATGTNFVKECSLHSDRKIKITTNADTVLSSSQYSFLIKNIPSPKFETTAFPSWATIFLTGSTTTGFPLTHRSAPGYHNASIQQFLHNPQAQVLNWFVKTGSHYYAVEDDVVEVGIGTFNCEIYLGASTMGESKVTSDITFSASNLTQFSFWPNVPRLNVGVLYQKVIIASKADSIPGIYVIKSSKNDPLNMQTEIARLKLLVREKNCTITPSMKVVNIPVTGRSLPLVFDFSSCLPLKEILITATLNSSNSQNISLVGSDNATSQTKSLQFINYNQTKISFVFESQNSSSVVGSSTVVNFTLSGSSAPYYNALSQIKIFLTDPEPLRVVPWIISFKASSLVGHAILYMTCSAPGNALFAIGLVDEVYSIDYTEIKQKTNDTEKITEVDSKDISWKMYGFAYQVDTKPISLDISGVRSGGVYKAVLWCVNQLNIVSLSSRTTTWTQADNGGRLAILTFTFLSSVKINLDLRREISCALSKMLQIPVELSLTQEGLDCNSSPSRMLQNSSTSATSVSNSSVAPSYWLHYFYILPRFNLETSSHHLTLSTLISKPSFKSDMFALVSGGENGYPTITNITLNLDKTAMPLYSPLSDINPTITLNSTYLYFTVEMWNSSGIVYMGVVKNNSERPDPALMRFGFDKNLTNFLNFSKIRLELGKTYTQNFTDLEPNTTYKVYYMSSNDNPGRGAIYTDVYEKVVRTLLNSFAKRLTFGTLFLLYILISFLFNYY